MLSLHISTSALMFSACALMFSACALVPSASATFILLFSKRRFLLRGSSLPTFVPINNHHTSQYRLTRGEQAQEIKTVPVLRKVRVHNSSHIDRVCQRIHTRACAPAGNAGRLVLIIAIMYCHEIAEMSARRTTARPASFIGSPCV